MGAATLLFERHACLVTPDAPATRGRSEIRQILDEMIARRTRIEVLETSLLRAGDVASVAPQGKTFVQKAHPTLVLREIEGIWKLAIAALWGWSDRPRNRMSFLTMT